tara:strand:+ start:762 stop:917 length:156 start_codon:yes stop_codon:yes gene_type:complete
MVIKSIESEIEEKNTNLLFLRKKNRKNKAKKYVAKAILSPDAKQTNPIKLR